MGNTMLPDSPNSTYYLIAETTREIQYLSREYEKIQLQLKVAQDFLEQLREEERNTPLEKIRREFPSNGVYHSPEQLGKKAFYRPPENPEEELAALTLEELHLVEFLRDAEPVGIKTPELIEKLKSVNDYLVEAEGSDKVVFALVRSLATKNIAFKTKPGPTRLREPYRKMQNKQD